MFERILIPYSNKIPKFDLYYFAYLKGDPVNFVSLASLRDPNFRLPGRDRGPRSAVRNPRSVFLLFKA